MGDRYRNPDEHQTTTTTLRPPVDSLIMTLRVVDQNPDDGQVNDVEMENSQPQNPVDDQNHSSSASHRGAAETSQGGSSSRRAVAQVIEGNENSEGQQELGHFKVPKTTANTLIQGGGVAQTITGNKNSGKGQSIGCFDIYDDDDSDDD